MEDTSFHSLTSETDWTDALSHSAEEPVVVFKHSSACSLSARAHEQIRILDEIIDLPIYKLVVQKNRSLSNRIEESLGIRHETPQAIILDGRTPAFDTSHFDVTVDTLRDALRSIVDSN